METLSHISVDSQNSKAGKLPLVMTMSPNHRGETAQVHTSTLSLTSYLTLGPLLSLLVPWWLHL